MCLAEAAGYGGGSRFVARSFSEPNAAKVPQTRHIHASLKLRATVGRDGQTACGNPGDLPWFVLAFAGRLRWFRLMETEFRIWKRRLPHWEVSGGRYFITIRCTGSLPTTVRRQLEEIRAESEANALGETAIEARQRAYFRVLENYLDQGVGFAPFQTPSAARIGLQSMRCAFEKEGWAVGPLVIMPNHCHVIVRQCSEAGLEEVMKRVKGRVARETNAFLGRSGKLWQGEWFDRWIRDDAEYGRTARYIRNNPVKAGLAANAAAYSGYDAGPADLRLLIR